MILAIDIGNTNIEIGILHYYKNDYNIINSVRFFTRLNITSDELGLFICNFLTINNINKNELKKVIYSSVVPPLNNIIKEMILKYFSNDYIEVNEKTKLEIKNCYKNPKEVGSDRLVNAQAAYKIYKKNSIIIDMGTATTICIVLENGDYLGGVIFPGILTSSQALKEKASKLPSITIQKKEKIIADNTIEAIESGVYFSNYFAIKGMINKIIEELNLKDYIIIGTGGIANIYKETDLFDIIDPYLTLKGLKIISDLN